MEEDSKHAAACSVTTHGNVMDCPLLIPFIMLLFCAIYLPVLSLFVCFFLFFFFFWHLWNGETGSITLIVPYFYYVSTHSQIPYGNHIRAIHSTVLCNSS